MPGTRTLNRSCGPRPSNPSRKNSPAADELWSRSSPAAPVQSPESGSAKLSSYFADTTLEADLQGQLDLPGLAIRRRDDTGAGIERCPGEDGRVRVLERRVVQDVEELAAELHGKSFGDPRHARVFEQRRIDAPQVRS